MVNGNDVGWGSSQTLLTLGLAALLLGAFVVVMFRSKSPMIPRVLLRYRNLIGANIGALIALSGMFAMFFYLVLWMRQINGWSPLDAGFAFLPVTVFIIVGAGIASATLSKIGPRPLVFFGPMIAGAGLLMIGIGLEPDSTYAGKLLPGLLMMAFGMGMAFVAFTSAALAGIPKDYSGVASALLNASQQVGGAVGLAVLTAIAIGRTATLFPGPAPDFIGPEGVPADPVALGAYIDATVDGFAAAITAGGILLILSGLVMGALIRVKPGEAVLPSPAG